MRKPILILCLSSLLYMHTKAQGEWNLKRCIAYAISNNLSVKEQDVQARMAALTWKQSKLGQYPAVSFGSSLGMTTGRSIDRTTNLFTTQSILFNNFNLQTGADLYNFGAKKATIQANHLQYEAQLAGVEKLKSDVTLHVLGAYLQVLLDSQQTGIFQVQLNQTAAQLINTRKLVKAGLLPELNALQLEAQLTQDSATLIEANGTLQKSLLQLKSVLNFDTAIPFDVDYNEKPVIVFSLAALKPELLYATAMRLMPQQKIDSLLAKAAEKTIVSTKKSFYPTLSIGGNLQTTYSNAKNNLRLLGTTPSGYIPIGIVEGTGAKVVTPSLIPIYEYYANPYATQLISNFGNNVGLTLSVPILNGATARITKQKALLNREIIQLQQQQNDLNLQHDIYNAFVDASNSLQALTASKKSVEATERAYILASKRYNLGLLNLLELTTIQSKLFNSRLRQVVAEYDYIFKMKILEFYGGNRLEF
ncbi:MAG TPA: TolC family protein [Segetibacter sp.]